MYADRFRVLKRAYSSASRNNKVYESACKQNAHQKLQLDFLESLHVQLHEFELAITEKESLWRAAILSVLESEIIDDLTWVYPTDGYRVQLDTRILRGKIHIEAKVSSTFAEDLPGRIKNTQGRLFQQVVSFAALIGVMSLLGVKTIYIDEAFSGSSRPNIKKLNKLLSHIGDRGFNLVMIAQDTVMADGISANRLFLKRSIDNKTTVLQEVT